LGSTNNYIIDQMTVWFVFWGRKCEWSWSRD